MLDLRRSALFAACFALFVACTDTTHVYVTDDGGAAGDDGGGGGGDDTGDDGGTLPGHDGGKKPNPTDPGGDASANPCNSTGGMSNFEPNSCTIDDGWTCDTATGFDQYKVACSCPSATCACILNNKTVKTVPYNGCPDCVTGSKPLSVLCGWTL